MAQQSRDELMTNLQRVSVEGFKAIDSLEFEPGAINVVTGRNNSGKTSLLEAIDLLVQPTNFEKYRSNPGAVINYQHDRSQIRGEIDRHKYELFISTPNEGQASNLLPKVIRVSIHAVLEGMAKNNKISEEELISVVDESLKEVYSKNIDKETLENVRDEMMILTIDGGDYPYFTFGPEISQVYSEIMSDIFETVIKDMSGVDSKSINSIAQLVEIPGYVTSGIDGFIHESPPDLGEPTFIDFAQLSETLDINKEDADPVIIDDIGDFLNEKDIVKNLKSFTPNHLIFEDEGGVKYSVPFDHMGEGFKAFVGILWHLLDDDDGPTDIILLEEPNTHMHPGYVRQLTYFLIELAREEDVQLFITTHNNDFLNDFFTENLKAKERDFLEEEFRLVQMQDGTADVMTYEEAEKQLKDLHLDLRGI